MNKYAHYFVVAFILLLLIYVDVIKGNLGLALLIIVLTTISLGFLYPDQELLWFTLFTLDLPLAHGLFSLLNINSPHEYELTWLSPGHPAIFWTLVGPQFGVWLRKIVDKRKKQ